MGSRAPLRRGSAFTPCRRRRPRCSSSSPPAVRRWGRGWEEGGAKGDQHGAGVIKERAATGEGVRAPRTPAELAEAERRQRDLAPRADDLSRRVAELAEMARTNHLAGEATIARQER